MHQITLGKTGLVIEKNGFGCLPIQRISEAEAVRLLHKAYDGGINFFDTARAYSDSEQKVGAAFSSMRERIVLATKTGAQTAEGFWKDLETSLRTLKTDYIDIYPVPQPRRSVRSRADADGLYDAALEAKEQGNIRHISITNHRLARGPGGHRLRQLYETLQFPFSYLCTESRSWSSCATVPRAGHGLHRHEGHGGRTDPRRLRGRGVDGDAGGRRADLGRAARE